MRIIEIGTAVSVLIIPVLVIRNLVICWCRWPPSERRWSLRRHVVRARRVRPGRGMQAIDLYERGRQGGNRLRRLSDKSLYHIMCATAVIGHGGPEGLMSIGKVITASAATVAVTFLAMVFTKLEVFRR